MLDYAKKWNKYADTMHRTLSPEKQSTPARAVIVGARGYSGLELARLLLRHPYTKLVACLTSGVTGWKLSDSLPEVAAFGVPTLPLEIEALPEADVFFLATPAEASAALAPAMVAQGKTVIDLSGAFRLDRAGAKRWYGLDTDPASYGLVPWAAPAQDLLIANPGCYATAVLMAILPLLKEGLIRPETLVIDAKSGTSGAGRKAAESLLFTEVDGECLPYKVGRHQHLPEINRYAREFAGVEIDPFFTTHLLPARRGILASIYARTDAGPDEIVSAFARAYSDYPLVRVGSTDSARDLSVRQVVGTARTQISFGIEKGKLHVFSLIDNLLKGAASQAVENLNRLADRPPQTGLLDQQGVL
jgi:N-acetyl-gamma-glutamyl-phosphate reductase